LYGSGTSPTKDQFISTNQYGYDIDEITVTGLNVGLSGGTYWLNLQSAKVSSGDPEYWDENNGVGRKGDNGMGGNCPSELRTRAGRSFRNRSMSRVLAAGAPLSPAA
jgi:hypothetical protein